MRRIRTILHSAYTGSSDTDGYPTGDEYGSAIERASYGWYPLSSQLSPAGEYDRRVITSKVVLVPDPTVFSARDKVVLPGTDAEVDRTYFVSEDMRDYTTGPYGYDPGGEIVVEKVAG